MLLIRSPYSALGTENMADLYVPFGFAVVEQNERGLKLLAILFVLVLTFSASPAASASSSSFLVLL